MDVGVGVEVGVGIGVGVAVGVGGGVGVGEGVVQSTSSNALKAKKSCKRKGVRMGRIIVRSAMYGNSWNCTIAQGRVALAFHWRAPSMSTAASLNLPIGQKRNAAEEGKDLSSYRGALRCTGLSTGA